MEEDKVRGQHVELMRALLSHDLRNPVNVISLATDTLTSIDGPAREHPAIVGSLRRSTRRLDLLLSQLADFTSVVFGGGLRLHVERVPAAALCRSVVEDLQRDADGAGTVRCAPADGAPVEVDPDRLQQAVRALVRHAMATATTPVEVRCDSGEDNLQVSVSYADTTESAQLDALFEPRREGPTPEALGLGLGLYLARQIALAHGGDLSATSADGEGTSILLRVPTQQVRGA